MPPKGRGKAKAQPPVAKLVPCKAKTSTNAKSVLQLLTETDKSKPARKSAAPKKAVNRKSVADVLNGAAGKILAFSSSVAVQLTPAQKTAASLTLKRKLGYCLDMNKLSNYVNDKGELLLDVVAAHRVEMQAQGKYIQPEFWDQIRKDFKLPTEDWKDMPEAPVDEVKDAEPDEQLGPAVVQVLGSSFAHKKSALALLEKKLAGPELPLWQIRLLLQQTTEGPGMSRSYSQRLLLAILGHLDAYNLIDRWPDGWRFMHSTMEQVFVAHWDEVNGTWGRSTFIKKYAGLLRRFLPSKEFDIVEKALGDKASLPPAALSELLKTSIGARLYEEQRSEMEWSEFLRRAADLLKNVMHLDFAADEVEAVRKQMQDMTRAMNVEVTATEDSLTTGWLGYQMHAPITHVDDFWEVPMYVALTCCALNSGKAPRMPWEDLLLEKEPIAFYPEKCNLDPQVCHHIVDSRTAMLPHLTLESTLAGWKKQMSVHSKNMQLLNSFWYIDQTFLEQFADEAFNLKVRSKIDDLISKVASTQPSDYSVLAVKKKLIQINHDLQELRASKLVLAIGDEDQTEIVWTSGFVSSILEFSSPSASVIASFSEWRRNVISKLAGLVQTAFTTRLTDGQVTEESRIVGQEAIVHRFNAFQKEPESDNARASLRRCELFRMFPWCLTDESSNALDDIVKQCVSKIRGGVLDLRLADKPSAETVQCEIPSAASSSKGPVITAVSTKVIKKDAPKVIVSPQVMKGKKVTKRDEEPEEEEEDADKKRARTLLTMFSRKPVA